MSIIIIIIIIIIVFSDTYTTMLYCITHSFLIRSLIFLILMYVCTIKTILQGVIYFVKVV